MSSKLLKLEHIKINQDLKSQQDVFELIASIAVDSGIASNAVEVVEGLIKREHESTTGFQEGFAIPHAQTDTISEPGIIVISSKKGIEWSSLDGKPASFFIALLIPKNQAGTTHINALASVSKMLIHESNREALASADSPEKVLDVISSALN
ncbi:PTS sugar transporter subunit IIA [Paraliobacillus sp. PM-2]|uniref:PTS sugar transporter subunit IIA n=1 Tax=Paraliobacillus sp. PM-2 TaxID=1462524 RepID=UPI00159ED1E7|nr:PTS sugar transporter subunit IIA [Paraliobacillus sp. PM-2]